MVKKLEWYGIKGKVSFLLRSYLTERKHLVSFGGFVSTCENIDVVLSKGSVLALLFLRHLITYRITPA